VEIVTPENISFRYWLAGPSRRLPAYLMDVVIQALVLILAWLGLGFAFGSPGLFGVFIGLFLVILFLVHWFYGSLLEAVWNGQTLGKRAMRIRVLTVQGQPIRAWQAVLRNVLRAVDAMPVIPLIPAFFGLAELSLPLFAVGLLWAALNDRFQRLGDWAAGTMVVVDETAPLGGVLKFRDSRVVAMAESIPPSFQATRTLGLALSLYVQRRKVLSAARRREIARHLGEAFCKQFDLPTNTDYDLLLCGMYQKAFLGTPPAKLAGVA
jgi:uncharacterized RDD family membrane protein YckC